MNTTGDTFTASGRRIKQREFDPALIGGRCRSMASLVRGKHCSGQLPRRVCGTRSLRSRSRLDIRSIRSLPLSSRLPSSRRVGRLYRRRSAASGRADPRKASAASLPRCTTSRSSTSSAKAQPAQEWESLIRPSPTTTCWSSARAGTGVSPSAARLCQSAVRAARALPGRDRPRHHPMNAMRE